MRQASSKRHGLACGPAIARAKALEVEHDAAAVLRQLRERQAELIPAVAAA